MGSDNSDMDTLQTFFYHLQFRRNALWIIPLLLFITFPLWSIPVGNFLAPPKIEQNENGQIDQQRNFNLQGVKITLNQEDRKAAFILASQARTTSADTLLMEDVSAEIYDQNGNITKIKAQEGEYNTTTQLLVLKKDVVVHKTIDKQVLYTQLLHYHNTEQTVNCPGATRIIAPGALIDSGSFDYDIETATYQLGKPVRCKITDFADGS